MESDQAQLEAFMGRMIGHMTGGAVCYSIWLGDELGLYRELTNSGPRTADSVAEKAGCHPRLVREWLDGQAAAGLVAYDADPDTYELGPEAALALANEASPVFIARAMNTLASMFMDMKKTATAFRGDGALSWGDHHLCLFSGTEWFFRTGYRVYLTTSWIPALEGVEPKLKAGARVADVGCGHGASVVAMAAAYPNSTFSGFDFHAPSIETCRERASEAGLSGRAQFQVATSTRIHGSRFPSLQTCSPDADEPHHRSQGVILLHRQTALPAAHLRPHHNRGDSDCEPNRFHPIATGRVPADHFGKIGRADCRRSVAGEDAGRHRHQG